MMLDLNVVWFLILGVLMMGYAILDGFDLGVGIIHPFIRDDHDRRLAINSIGPLWDGNEVWLVTFGGALFAAFPVVYAAVLSGFYLPVMLLLASLVGRAVSIEFRSKVDRIWWRRYWDFSFFLSSTLVTFIFGVALGNVLKGVPIGPEGTYTGGVLELFNVYAVSVGLLAVAGAAMHGSIYLYLKTEGELQLQIQSYMWTTFGLFMVMYMFVTIQTLATVPHAVANFEHYPIAWFVVLLNILAIANIPRAIYRGNAGYAFVSSAATIAAFTFLTAMALFPNLVVSSTDPVYSLNIYNAASSQATLWLMFIIALIGMPLVMTYTSIVYWLFRGKVELNEFSY